VEATPSAPFKMSEPDLLLELLEVASSNLAYPVRCHSCCRVGPVTAVEIFVRRS